MRKNRRINCLEVAKQARSAEELKRILETMNINGIRLLCRHYHCKKSELKKRILNDKYSKPRIQKSEIG